MLCCWATRQVFTPELKRVMISENRAVEQIWHCSLSWLSSCVQNLVSLVLTSCYKVNVLFSSSTAIMDNGKMDTILFPKLKSLHFGYLRSLTRLCSGYHVKFPSLKVISIMECNQWETFVFYETVC